MLNLINATKQRFNKENVLWEDIKFELKQHHLNYKEDENLSIIYHDGSDIIDIDIKSCIIEKKTLKVIASQFNNIIYNADAFEILDKLEHFDNVRFYECYEGTLLVVFYYNNKWYVTTRRCLESNTSTWVANTTYYELFNEAKKFDLDKLDKRYFYHFVLLHHKNKNIIDYSYLYGEEYKELIHVLTVDINTMIEIEYYIEGCKYPLMYNFKNTEEITKKIKEMTEKDVENRRITTEGYIVKLNGFTTMKLQTYIYADIFAKKPNNPNIHQAFIELYQNDRLDDFVEFFGFNLQMITKRIHHSFKVLCEEVIKLYYITRNKKNERIYLSLTPSYRKVLYDIHGEYIRLKSLNKTGKIHINIHNIYSYFKKLQTKELINIFYDRFKLINNNVPIFRRNNRHINEQTDLMFT